MKALKEVWVLRSSYGMLFAYKSEAEGNDARFTYDAPLVRYVLPTPKPRKKAKKTGKRVKHA